MSSIFIVAFTKLNGIILPNTIGIETTQRVNPLLASFSHELLNYGYLISNELYTALSVFDNDSISYLYTEILRIAKESVGAHVKHEAFYPNFPAQVMNASEAELLINAFVHYWSCGVLRPLYEKVPRLKLDEDHPVTPITLITIEKVKEYFFSILSSKSSIPNSLSSFVDEGILLGWVDDYTGEIPFRETLCRIAANMVRNGQSIDSTVTVTTDILRVMAKLSDSDIDLKRKIWFKSLPRSQRRIIISALEKVITISDVKMYPDVWKHAFHCLHAGEYGGKVAAISSMFRNQNNVHTPDTVIAEAIKAKDIQKAVDGLKHKPSVFARALDKLIRDCKNEEDFDYVLRNFTQILPSVNSKVLLQILGHFQGRLDSSITTRIVFTAGSKGTTLHAPLLPKLSTIYTTKLIDCIKSSLKNSFQEKALLAHEKVFISPDVDNILVPFQLASLSNTKNTVARGSRIPLDKDNSKPIIRLFVHWIGVDIDLSAYMMKEDFSDKTYVSYQNLRTEFAIHSGDITRAPAPNGASEFIDIDINKALDYGYRYISMDVRVYIGPGFNEHEQCFAGFMLRQGMDSGEIFEPSTVRCKFDLTSDTASVVPCLFDLRTKQIVWIDTPVDQSAGHNSLTKNFTSVSNILKAYLEMYKTKITISQLIQLHADSVNAEITTNQHEATFTVGLGLTYDLNIYDFTTINSLWI